MTARYLLLVAIVCLVSGNVLRAAEPSAVAAGGVTGLDLKTQLQKGLRARRPVEFEYINEIIALVESGELPKPLEMGSKDDFQLAQALNFLKGAPVKGQPSKAVAETKSGS